MSDELVPALTRLLDQALRRVGELGEAGDRDHACRVAAQAWALLDRPFPKEARRLQGTLHYLTLVAPNRPPENLRDAG